ncbi:hypothetical protein [Haloarcula halophila]|uniref:hypothetical protein n=1 Tax=Haloarcula TaxID=2237 RepID=UPI0023E3EA51|nr:hypothetical protein [Halomicroarcula sp. DFY41]
MCEDCLTREEVEEIVAEETAELRAELEGEREQRKAAEAERDRLQERVDELEARAYIDWDSGDERDIQIVATDGTRYPLGRAVKTKVAETDLQERLDDLRDRLAEGDLAEAEPEPESPTIETETPLEDIVALPESVAETELSANQQRARFLARDVRDYADKAPAGWCLTAGQVGTVLKAGLDITPHSETVRRVIQILEDLCDDAATVRKRRGEKRIVFDEDLVQRLERQQANDGVRTAPA